jgi:hypothetical protein
MNARQPLRSWWLWGVVGGGVGGLVWALSGRPLFALLMSGLLPLHLDSTQYTLLTMGLYLMCLLAASLVASAASRHLASGIVAGALVLPVSLTTNWLYTTLAYRAPFPLIDWRTAPYTLAVILLSAAVGAVGGAVGGALGVLSTRAWARQRLATAS